MAFSEECVRFGDRLAKLVDAGVPVKDAAVALGISAQRCYAILRVMGRPVGSPRPTLSGVDPEQVVAVFTATGSINQAAKANGISHGSARRMLVDKGLVAKQRHVYGKPAARVRFVELLESGCSVSQAAGEVGVNVRTARDWRDGISKIGDTRIRSDGTVIDYSGSRRYIQSVKTTQSRSGPDDPPATNRRHLSMSDRLAIADGLQIGQTLTAIAVRIGKHTSTVSRECRRHSIDGLYLPYQADKAAAANRARPKQSKLVTNDKLRQAVTEGLSQRWSPEEISHRLVKDFTDDESMRVSHETIYQALYFQARGGLKREVAQALRSGRTRRKPHRAPDQRTHRFIDPMIMISDRPAEITDRAVPGHWEGDLVRHEALCDRAEVEDLRRCAVAAA